MRQNDFINEKLYDIRLITVGDYTVQANIPPEVWKAYKESMPDTNELVLKFEKKLTTKIEGALRGYGLSE